MGGPRESDPFNPPHGGYRDLKPYQMAEIIHGATVLFCDRFIEKRSRTHDKIVQSTRSGKQNIPEGSVASGTSKMIGQKLVGMTRANLEVLLVGFQNFLRLTTFPLWGKEHPQAREVRALAHRFNRSYSTYKPYFKKVYPETAANAAIFLIRQPNYLLDRQLRALEKGFLGVGDFKERICSVR